MPMQRISYFGLIIVHAEQNGATRSAFFSFHKSRCLCTEASSWLTKNMRRAVEPIAKLLSMLLQSLSCWS